MRPKICCDLADKAGQLDGIIKCSMQFDACVQASIIPSMIKILQNPTAPMGVKADITLALKYLTANSQRNRDGLIAANGLAHLIPLLQSASTEAQYNTARILRHMALASPPAQKRKALLAIVPLVEALKVQHSSDGAHSFYSWLRIYVSWVCTEQCTGTQASALFLLLQLLSRNCLSYRADMPEQIPTVQFACQLVFSRCICLNPPA